MARLTCLLLSLVAALSILSAARGQEKSVKPGINDSFRDPNVQEFTERFEIESREVFARRKEIVAACDIRPGETVADIGAGTGLFSRLFSEAVGRKGRVIAVDISQKFLDYINERSRQAGQQNVDTLLATADSTMLPENSVDFAFICDTYHHFEFPQKTLASLHQALKPGGRVVLIDFRRIEGESSEWTLNHVRAGQEVFEAEIQQAGFRKTGEERALLKENYFVVFEKQARAANKSGDSAGLQRASEKRASERSFPIIQKYGGVLPRPSAAEQPVAGAKVVFDVTADSKPEDVNRGLDRVARLLNLYGSAGLKASDVKVAIVLHDDATKSSLKDEAYNKRFTVAQNPNLPLIEDLRKAGVEVFVCSQALHYKRFPESEVAANVQIAAAALTVVINKQQQGYAYIPVN